MSLFQPLQPGDVITYNNYDQYKAQLCGMQNSSLTNLSGAYSLGQIVTTREASQPINYEKAKPIASKLLLLCNP